MNDETHSKTNFIRQIIDADLASGKHDSIHTRFPPEPNGYLHIGHAKSIALNFGIAQDYKGLCNLRYDDTNPHKENIEYVTAIQEDVKWLGYQWHDQPYYSSDYFDKLAEFALELIDAGKAYVCELDAEQMRTLRGTLKDPGTNSPYRDRSITENRNLFERMQKGEFTDGSRTLRAKIDMASPNMNMRDPVLYRIRHGVIHHQTGAEWCLYPMYDFTHPISDALEGITHSLCTLEFLDHRPLYDWMLDNLSIDCHPQQIEFSRLNLEYTITSKRKLTQLVTDNHVEAWNDPRMPTISGMRRRGYSPAAIRNFCEHIGISKSENRIEMSLLESCVREDLDKTAPRRMGVLDPLKVIISNYPEDKQESLSAANHPKDPSMGTREVPFSREIWIDRADFKEQANKKYKRMITHGLVRLRNGYVIRCDEVIKQGEEIIELHCSYYPNSLESNPQGEKVRGVIHWVSVAHAIPAEVRLYDRLFSHPTPDREEGDFTNHLNPESLIIRNTAWLEPSLKDLKGGQTVQFEREGFFCRDEHTDTDTPIFNRTVTLRDNWGH